MTTGKRTVIAKKMKTKKNYDVNHIQADSPEIKKKCEEEEESEQANGFERELEQIQNNDDEKEEISEEDEENQAEEEKGMASNQLEEKVEASASQQLNEFIYVTKGLIQKVQQKYGLRGIKNPFEGITVDPHLQCAADCHHLLYYGLVHRMIFLLMKDMAKGRNGKLRCRICSQAALCGIPPWHVSRDIGLSKKLPSHPLLFLIQKTRYIRCHSF